MTKQWNSQNINVIKIYGVVDGTTLAWLEKQYLTEWLMEQP